MTHVVNDLVYDQSSNMDLSETGSGVQKVGIQHTGGRTICGYERPLTLVYEGSYEKSTSQDLVELPYRREYNRQLWLIAWMQWGFNFEQNVEIPWRGSKMIPN